jgi:protein-S-isoprenylcysteine O-methyltransferase Ste14
MEASPKPRPPGDGMLPPRKRRRFAVETVFMRLVATAGVVGIGVAVAAVMGSSDVDSWIIGLVVALLSVILAAILWSSRQL